MEKVMLPEKNVDSAVDLGSFGNMHSQSLNLKEGHVCLKLRQKVAELELALANQTSSNNSEVVALEEELAKLRASFERNELSRRKLEYELTVARKELNDEVRNKIEEGEVKRKELDACKEEIAQKSAALESVNSLLHDQEILYDTQKENMGNEISILKTKNVDLQNRIHELELENDDESKRGAIITNQLNEKVLEMDQTKKSYNQQLLQLEKEKVDLSKRLNELISLNSSLKEESDKCNKSWKNKTDELVNKHKTLESEVQCKRSEIKSLQESLESQKAAFDRERGNVLMELNNQRASSRNMQQENEKAILNWKNKCEELGEKCSMLESQRIEHTATIHKLVNDNKQICNNEQEWIEKNKELHSRVKSLLDNIEAERATHLETKFSTELLERKLQEMEGALDNERGNTAVNKLSAEEMENKYKQLEEVKKSLEGKNNELESKFEVQSKELMDKSVLLSNTNLELGKYKEELSKMQSNMSSIQSNERNILKELHLLLDNHENQFDMTGLPDEWELHHVVDVLSLILKEFRSHLKDSDERVRVAALSIERLNIEVNTKKQDVLVNNKALEEADRLVKTAQHHGSVLEVKCANFEKQIEALNGEICLLNSELLARNEKIAGLSNSLDQAKLRIEQSVQSTIGSFQVMYDLLFRGSVQPKPSSYSMNELKDIIVDKLKHDAGRQMACQEEIAALRSEAKQSADELMHFKQMNKKMKKSNSDLASQNRKHLDEVTMLKQMLEKEIETCKIELEEAKLDKNCALEKYSEVEKLINETDLVNEKLKKSLHLSENENKYIVACMVIITGGLWALVTKHQSLCIEKAVLVNIVRQLFKLKGDVLELADTIHLEVAESETISRTSCRIKGIFRFRIAVIAVLAAQRFQKIGSTTRTIKNTGSSLTCCYDLLFYGVLSGKNKKAENFKKELELSMWLNDNNVLKNACLDAVIPLVGLDKANNSCASFSQDNLIETVCTCYTKYLESVKLEMDRSSAICVILEERKKSMIYQLGSGLRSLLLSKDSYGVYKPVDTVTSVLRQSLLDLTMKHHNSEKEKVTLIETCEQYEADNNKLHLQIGTHIAMLEETESTLKAHIWDLEKQIDKTVSEEQFEDVCRNLDSALKREDHLQILLKEQKNEIVQITSKIDKQEISYQQSINLFTSNFKNHQVEFHSLQGRMEELKDKLFKLEKEKEDLSVLLGKEHGTMEAFLLERKIVAEYIKKVSSVLKKTGHKLDAVHVNKLSKLHEILPQKVLGHHGKTLSPEMETIQAQVITIVDLHRGVLDKLISQLNEMQTLQSKISSLEKDAKAHKLNVHKLKNQISALCQEDTLDNEIIGRAKETSSPVFVPLNSS